MNKKRYVILFFVFLISFICVSAQDIEPSVVRVWSTLEIGKNSMFITNIDIAFTELYFTTKEKHESITLTVKKKNYLAPQYLGHEGILYQYLNVDKVNLKDSDISDTIIKFRVTKNWINENNINGSSILLLRYSDNWQRQETELYLEDETYYYYTSDTNGFSYFVIVGFEKAYIPVVEEPEEVEEIIEEIIEEPEKELNTKMKFIIIIGVITIVGIVFINVKNRLSFSAKNLPDLENYVALAKAQGEPYTKIKTELLNAGWNERDIDSLMKKTKLPKEIKQKMIDYVQKSIKQGKDKEDIRREFMDTGWQQELVDDLFNSIT